MLSFFSKLVSEGHFELNTNDVEMDKWADKIKAHFESRFYISLSEEDDN